MTPCKLCKGARVVRRPVDTPAPIVWGETPVKPPMPEHDVIPCPGCTPTPRERDPAVWAAAYARAHGRLYDDLRAAADGTPDERHTVAMTLLYVEQARVRRHLTEVADAAVMALHPDPV